MSKQAKESQFIELDKNPTPEEEEQAAFSSERERKESLANDLAEQDIQQRRQYAERAFCVVIIWISVICIVMAIHLILRTSGVGTFTQAEFIAIITTTTASAFGFWLLVGQGLFPKSKD